MTQPTVATPFGRTPVLPLALLAIGAYLTWFGVHYWRSDTKWPSDPVKNVLTGKPIPTPKVSNPDLSQIFQSVGPAIGGVIAGGSRVAIAVDAQKYVGSGYVFGGNADRVGNWDCSSFLSYVLGHDEGLPLPGGKWGDPGMPPHAHGPGASQYLVYGSAINASDLGAGDLVVWNTHCGVAINPTQIVSARDEKEGVGISNIAGTAAELGETTHYRRVAV